MRSIHLILFAVVLVCAAAEEPRFKNLNVIKTVDLMEAIVKVTLRFNVHPFENNLKEYRVAIPKEDIENMAYIAAYTSKQIPLTIRKIEKQDRYVFLKYIYL
jgi:hypothetical protein